MIIGFLLLALFAPAILGLVLVALGFVLWQFEEPEKDNDVQ